MIPLPPVSLRFPIFASVAEAQAWAAEVYAYLNDLHNHQRSMVEEIQSVARTGQTYSVSNAATDRTFDADATTAEELGDVLGTLIADLRAKGVVD